MKGNNINTRIQIKNDDGAKLDDVIVANKFAHHFQKMSANSNYNCDILSNRSKTINTYINENITNNTVNEYLIEDSKMLNLNFNLSELNTALKKIQYKICSRGRRNTDKFFKALPS